MLVFILFFLFKNDGFLSILNPCWQNKAAFLAGDATKGKNIYPKAVNGKKKIQYSVKI